jgi:hypothetical protein
MTHQEKPPGSAATAPRGINPKPREGFKGWMHCITRRRRKRPHSVLAWGRNGGEPASADA